ncbi:MAG: lipoate--protein ligase family protein [SAR324 cluster bacterium]|nr:lipoate--protein ligase family protein [SAR324 cluster bacterium]
MQGKIRFIPFRKYEPALNMALDQVLLESDEFIAGGGLVLRLYGWSTPTLSLGKSQKEITDIDLNLARERGLSLVRRSTGGQTVLHDQELTYSVVGGMPPFSRGVIESYKMIALPLQQALLSLGTKVELAGVHSDDKPKKFKPTSSHCFLEPSAHEVMVGGKKLIGSAQKRSKGKLLQHGSLPLAINRQLWAELWQVENVSQDDGSRYTSLSEALNREVKIEELYEPLKKAFSEAFKMELVDADFSAEELALAAQLVKSYQV